MKYVYRVLLMVMIVSFSKIEAQVTQKLFFSGENYAWQYQFAKDNGIPVAYLIYQRQFVNTDGLTFNKKLMETTLDKMIPDKNAYGYAVLDWEGPIYNALAGFVSVTQATYQQYLNQYIATIRYAKFLRPNIQWSYYFLPTFLYTPYAEEKTPKYHARRMQLLKELDFLAPSFYVFYDGKTVEQSFASQYIDDNLKYALDLGRMLNKEVYCFVWHRWCPGTNIPNGNMLMDYATYKKIISRIINTQFQNRKPDGLIWWNCEDYLYSVRSSSTILTNEYKNVTDIASYKLNILKTYLDSTRAVMNQ